MWHSAKGEELMLELASELKPILQDAAAKLKGSARRTFLAKVVRALGPDGQRRAERELGWDRETIRKGTRELNSGFAWVEAFRLRGRKKAEEHLPHLLDDLRELADRHSQTDPTFQSQRLYTRLSAATLRRQLIEQKGYSDDELPSEQTLTTKLNELGYRLKTVAKTRPQKKIPQTDAIFRQLEVVHSAQADDEGVLRVSYDTKTPVKIGLFSRGGPSRLPLAAWDHDFRPETVVTPAGFLLPDHNELFLYLTTSKVTSDFIVDSLLDCWRQLQPRFPQVHTLQLDLDNGPENHSHRTQFIARLIEFVNLTRLRVELAYYPPYHSKYNPIERCWAVLENHWNGSLLDSLNAVVEFAKTMTWRGLHPVVSLVTKAYQTGVKLSREAMQVCEQQLERLPGLERWFVTIRPTTA
jgi:hypothetical protein